MKKLLVGFVAAFTVSVFAVAGNAAAFEAGNLGLGFIDDDTATELVIDLGDIASIVSATETVTLAEAGTFSLDYDRVGMFGYTLVTPIPGITIPETYYGLSVDVEATCNMNLLSAFTGGIDVISLGEHAVDIPSSYDTKLNTGADGGYGSFNNTYFAFGEAEVSADGFDMYLYQFSAGGSLVTEDGNNYVAVISFNNDGSIMLNQASAVPVPGAIVLLGTGLVGLVGLRRKMS